MYIAFEEVGVEIQKHAVLVEKNKKLLLHVGPNYYLYTSLENCYYLYDICNTYNTRKMNYRKLYTIYRKHPCPEYLVLKGLYRFNVHANIPVENTRQEILILQNLTVVSSVM